VGRRFEPVWAHPMTNLTNPLTEILFVIGRKLPKRIRRVLVGYYLSSQSLISIIKENRKLSDFPQKLDSSKKSLRESVQFDTHEIISRYQIKINSVCHVGAHKGQEISSYLQLGINSAVFIEPVRENYVVLRDLVRGIPNYKAIQLAVGNFEGIVKINLASNDFQSSSILQPHLHLLEAPKVSFDKSIESNISTLDLILSGSESWDLVVIDVQGYELEVLEGATRTLARCDYVFIEVNRAETYRNCAQIKDIDIFLLNLGFQRVLTKWWSSWGDAFYVRSTLLPFGLTTK